MGGYERVCVPGWCMGVNVCGWRVCQEVVCVCVCMVYVCGWVDGICVCVSGWCLGVKVVGDVCVGVVCVCVWCVCECSTYA